MALFCYCTRKNGWLIVHKHHRAEIHKHLIVHIRYMTKGIQIVVSTTRERMPDDSCDGKFLFIRLIKLIELV